MNHCWWAIVSVVGVGPLTDEDAVLRLWAFVTKYTVGNHFWLLEATCFLPTVPCGAYLVETLCVMA
jgi:hypothetical protein